MEPEIAQRVVRIQALREVIRLRLERNDIAAAVETLQAVKRADDALRSETLALLADEERALLAAPVEGPAPGPVGGRMREASQKCREAHNRAWADLTSRIGARKANAIRGLVSVGPAGPRSEPRGPAGPPGPMGFPPGEGPDRPPMAPQPGMPGMPGAPQLANALITRLPVQEMIDLLAKRQAGLPKGR